MNEGQHSPHLRGTLGRIPPLHPLPLVSLVRRPTAGASPVPHVPRRDGCWKGMGGETCGEWRTHGVERGRKGVSKERPTGPVPRPKAAQRGMEPVRVAALA